MKWWLVLVLLTGPAQAQISVPCADSQMKERVREIILQGIDQGLRNQTAQAFLIWMKDTTAQPKRALAGLDTAVEAYMRSRENALKWNPSPCEGKP
jgi:hypothetical protein